jgi:hypothetical protein
MSLICMKAITWFFKHCNDAFFSKTEVLGHIKASHLIILKSLQIIIRIIPTLKKNKALPFQL